MKGLDTNVLVRYLTQDDPRQAARANAFIEETVARGDRCHLNHIVCCELVWVLQGAYKYERGDIAEVLEKILETSQFSVEERDLVSQALVDYRSGAGDFPDCLLGLRNQREGCRSTATFDRGLKRNPLFQVI